MTSGTLTTACCRPVITTRRPGVLVLVLFVVVLIIKVVVGGIIVVHSVARVIVSAALRRQLRTQPVKVRAAAVVLELASNLHLLGLGSAAPHWLDPLERPEPVRPHDVRLAGLVRRKTPPPPRFGERDVHQHPYRYNRTRFAPLMPTLIPSCPARFRAAGPLRTSGAAPGGPRPPMAAPRRRPR